MRRTNSFKVEWDEPREIKNLAIGCATLWNKLNYERRQAFFNNNFDFNGSEKFYEEFKDWVGSATAQQVIRKNDSAWRSFFSLLKKWRNGELDNGGRPSPPGYWKKKNGDKELRIIVRDDCYKIENDKIRLPFDRTGKIKGKLHWSGGQGRLEIIYDGLDECWRVYQSVEVDPKRQSGGDDIAFVDLGVIYPITSIVGGEAVAYNGKPLLSEWWQLTKRIEKHQSELRESRDKHSSERLRRLFKERKRKFRDSIRKIVKKFVERCWENEVSKIVAGDLSSIRKSTDFNKKANSMIHNYWSHEYLVKRLRWTAENYGLEVELVDERGTSSECPRCHEDEDIVKRGRLFKCKNCGLEAHRDVVGAQNIGLVYRGRTNEPTDREVINRVMAHPEVVSI